MGILDSAGKGIAGIGGAATNPATLIIGGVATGAISTVGGFLQNPFSQKVNNTLQKPDYPDGLIIQEILSTGKNGSQIRLLGNMMPKSSFDREVSLRAQKDHYPGNDEPVIHILGYEENDITIRGRLYDKRYKDKKFRGVANEIREALEEMEKRKNLIRLSLGEWRRYCFISKVKTTEKTLADIDYEVTFLILGTQVPKNYHLIDSLQNIPVDINNALIAEAAAFQATYSSIPENVPRSIADLLNQLTSSVAGVMKVVTGFIDGVITQGEDISTSISRAMGLTRYAQNQIIQYKRRVGGISYALSFSGMKVPERYKVSAFIGNSLTATLSLQALLAQLFERFRAMSKTIPLARHRVIKEDNLQRLSSKFYGSAEHWKRIYDHNKLTSTDLTTGAVLEIPRL